MKSQSGEDTVADNIHSWQSRIFQAKITKKLKKGKCHWTTIDFAQSG